MLLYGEWVEENILAPVAHRQYVFTVPRLLRPLFHVLAADGVFRADGTFVPLPPISEALLERGFRRAVLDFLVGEGAISEELRARMLGWRYSGFSVHNQVCVDDAEGRKKLAGYMLRAPLSLAKMTYDAASGTLNLPLEDAPWVEEELPGHAGRRVAGAALQAYSGSLRTARQVCGVMQLPRNNCHIRANDFVILVAANGRAMRTCCHSPKN